MKPYTVDLGRAHHNGWTLTHVEWHPCNMDVDIAQLESGLHEPDGTFHLLQHGWHNLRRVETLVWRMVDKGWDARRVEAFLQNLKERE